ncbi:SusF/SusE family outer membrane protein [Thermophagus sp. OGC60D27]|uniref:SusF/SusE family outer membrane protein n=1 Tax=Thermophagus sp. OGC60D27 TaxID=3458415 RepID=UPI0040378929
MHTIKINTFREWSIFQLPVSLVALFLGCFVLSCSDDFDKVDITTGETVSLDASKSEIDLTQKQADSEALSFVWTTGTNMGTGSSISYNLEIDREGNNFDSAMNYNMGKAVYIKSFSHQELNALLLEHLGVTGGEQVVLDVRITANVTDENVDAQTDVIQVKVTPYEPVSETLYMIGDATPNGWSADNATMLTPDISDPTTFTYKGALSEGELKFITDIGQFLPSYNKGADDNTLVFRTDDAQPDDKFKIEEAGIYAIKLNLVDLTISFEKQNGPAYEVLYLFGDATPNGWDIANAVEMTQDPDNLFLFTWEGFLNPGEFKIPVNRNTDFGQDMFMPDPEDPSQVYLHNGGDEDDNKWQIENGNYYYISLDISRMTISIEPFELYMVGSATPVGWDIGNAIQLNQDPENWYIFSYQGALNAGEFKFPVNRNSDWGQDMYMPDPDDHTKMYRHIGGDPDDNKWVIPEGEDGDYLVTLNMQDLSINIQKL